MRTAWAMIMALRPWQSLKNLVVFAAVIFARKADDPHAVLVAVLAFCAFCLASSAGYLVNDLRDLSLDRSHPKKRYRPIASGRLPPLVAAPISVTIGAVVASRPQLSPAS